MICIQKIYGLNGLNIQFIEPLMKGKWKTGDPGVSGVPGVPSSPGGPGGPYDIGGQNDECG